MTACAADERDARLRALIKTMFERVPKEKRLTVAVVMQLLRTKYAAVFPEEYLAERTGFLTEVIDAFYNPKNGEVRGNDAQAHEQSEEEEEEGDEEEDEEEEDEENSEDNEEEDEEGSASEEMDETSDDSGDSDGAPAEKRQRIEESVSEVVRRSHEMADCLRRLSYRVRKQEETESPEAYLQQYLVPLFREKGLDPARYSRADVKRYRVLKELEQLQEDGADMNLDRTARLGRGLNQLATGKETTINVKSSKFLDDE